MARKYQVVKIHDDMNYRTYTRIYMEYGEYVRMITVESKEYCTYEGWEPRRDYMVHHKTQDEYISKARIRRLAAFI